MVVSICLMVFNKSYGPSPPFGGFRSPTKVAWLTMVGMMVGHVCSRITKLKTIDSRICMLGTMVITPKSQENT
jgi:hypothetical protein